MELDECSAGGESVAEEEDDESLHGSRSNTCSSSSSGSSTSSESGDDSHDDHDSSGSDTQSSENDDNDENSNDELADGSIEDVRWENCIAAGTKIKLPQDLCEHMSIFHELLNYPQLWHEHLSEAQTASLSHLLPSFPDDCDVKAEQEKTLKMLFQRENQRFGVAPLDSIHTHLSSGHFRPDIRRMLRLVRKAQQRRLLFEERKRTYELADELFKSRQNLLLDTYTQSLDESTSTLHRTSTAKINWRKPKLSAIELKIQTRYNEELNTVSSELGLARFPDTMSENEENYPNHQVPGTKQKRKRKMNSQTAQMRINHLNHEDEAIRPVFSTLQREEYTPNPSFVIPEMTEESYRAMLAAHKKRRTEQDLHPELNTQGIALAELTQRAQIGQKHKLTFGAPIRTPSAKKRVKQEAAASPITAKPPPPVAIKSEFDANEFIAENMKQMATNQEIDVKPPEEPAKLTPIKAEPLEPYEIPCLPVRKKVNPSPPKPPKLLPPPMPEIKTEIDEIDYLDTEIKSECPRIPIPGPQIHPTEVEIEKKDLNLDLMMHLPIQLSESMDILSASRCDDRSLSLEKDTSFCDADDLQLNGHGDLMQETHACFFSLIRDAFTSKGEYRMSATEVKDAVTLWQGNPISPLNDWYSLAISWSAVVPSSLGFLAGELTYGQDMESEEEPEFVPYLENKGRGIYAWIGAGRDSDSRLASLCARFLIHRDCLGVPQSLPVLPEPPSNALVPVKSQLFHTNSNNSNGSAASVRSPSPVAETTDADPAAAISESEPPRALCPSEWKVRLSTPEEREEFQRQERLRYASPHKAFTYKMHGYTSAVGPVKGIYLHNSNSGLTKPRGHSLLVADRPNFVTILALVRDATARLPNGEGTRSDICMLLKDSQYIKEQIPTDGSNEKDNYLNSVVSGALDRLHYETDPCVRYYPRRKEWLYLHRARSESEFEMFHQQLLGVSKTKKSQGGTSRGKSQGSSKISNGKESGTGAKEPTPKKERKNAQNQSASKKEARVIEEKAVVEPAVVSEVAVQAPPQPPPPPAPPQPPPQPLVIPTTEAATPVRSIPPPAPPPAPPVTVSAATSPMFVNPPPVAPVEREIVDLKPHVAVQTPVPVSLPVPMPIVKKIAPSSPKPVALTKANAPQSLLQSNQHYPHHQIQVSTSAGLQTIRLSGHSVLHSAQPVTTSAAIGTSSNVATLYPTAKIQSQVQPTVMTNQAGKSLLQNTNIKQQQVQQVQQAQQQQQQQVQQQPQIQQQAHPHVLPGKTLLASQIKLVSSGQIKSLLTGHGMQGQTIFIKQSSPSINHTQHVQQLKQQQQQQQRQINQQQQQQLHQRLVLSQQQQQHVHHQQQQQQQQQPQQQQQQQVPQQAQIHQATQQTIQSPGMQRIIAQIGGKPIAVQIQQSPHQSQHQQQQKILAKVLTNASNGQLISVESLLSQKGLKLAAASPATAQVNRQGKQIIQTQYQVVSQAQASGQAKIIASTQQQQSGQQTVRMVTAQLAGKPIVLASGNKNVGVGISGGSVVLGKQQTSQGQSGQQPIILPSQLLNIKTLHGLKVIPTSGGLKTAGAAVYARVIAPTTITATQVSTVTPQQTSVQTQAPRNSPYGNP